MKTSLDEYFDGFFNAINSGSAAAEYALGVRMATEFGLYVDMLAASNPHRLHHVYEWGQAGVETARLFEMTVIPYGTGVTITYEFKNSVTPNANGEIFSQKATVMESGESVTFTTDRPVPINDGESFRVGSFTFVPGGMDTNGAFHETFMLYFSTRTTSVTEAGYTMPRSAATKSAGYRDGMSIYDRISS